MVKQFSSCVTSVPSLVPTSIRVSAGAISQSKKGTAVRLRMSLNAAGNKQTSTCTSQTKHMSYEVWMPKHAIGHASAAMESTQFAMCHAQHDIGCEMGQGC